MGLESISFMRSRCDCTADKVTRADKASRAAPGSSSIGCAVVFVLELLLKSADMEFDMQPSASQIDRCIITSVHQNECIYTRAMDTLLPSYN